MFKSHLQVNCEEQIIPDFLWVEAHINVYKMQVVNPKYFTLELFINAVFSVRL